MLLRRAVRAALKDCKAALASCSEGRLSSENELVSRSPQSVRQALLVFNAESLRAVWHVRSGDRLLPRQKDSQR
eukprot:COSAG02_NODE_1079_length_14711_cov_86.326512_8_plen_74_part_00